MATNPLEASRGGGQEAKAPEEGAAAAPAPSGAGGIKAWLPLIVAVVTMPALAFATTKFVLLPKLQKAVSGPVAEAATPAASSGSSESSGGEGKSGGTSAPGKTKISVQMSKMLVNVAGTMGTRYLMASVTLVGNTADFKGKIEDNKDQLMDLATGTLSSKTISDLEKPGARNVIRSELITVFNNALGGPVVQEIYITELAIQ
jgi:flagellar FliL protein